MPQRSSNHLPHVEKPESHHLSPYQPICPDISSGFPHCSLESKKLWRWRFQRRSAHGRTRFNYYFDTIPPAVAAVDNGDNGNVLSFDDELQERKAPMSSLRVRQVTSAGSYLRAEKAPAVPSGGCFDSLICPVSNLDPVQPVIDTEKEENVRAFTSSTTCSATAIKGNSDRCDRAPAPASQIPLKDRHRIASPSGLNHGKLEACRALTPSFHLIAVASMSAPQRLDAGQSSRWYQPGGVACLDLEGRLMAGRREGGKWDVVFRPLARSLDQQVGQDRETGEEETLGTDELVLLLELTLPGTGFPASAWWKLHSIGAVIY
ncbi:hypothetical protein B0T21DRAFT_353162 [Apiosordaria backusii]|uniref:Uncharacterized protein n=1 Tax=Apiosordaria backusii TaxID=314023 RepID=A0AA39ZUY6_9PEZI|nr:hypothetical protein B0T21DRAFT_353162 [Apiosordaria backusii]